MTDKNLPGTGILTAHVADALEAITGNMDYDETADRAAGLVKGSRALREAAGRYSAGTSAWEEFLAVVRAELRASR
jgi:hypothetical protein